MTGEPLGPIEAGWIERGDGSPVTDEAYLYLPDGGTIEVEDTERAGEYARAIIAIPDMIDALQMAERLAVALIGGEASEWAEVKAMRAAIAKATPPKDPSHVP